MVTQTNVNFPQRPLEKTGAFTNGVPIVPKPTNSATESQEPSTPSAARAQSIVHLNVAGPSNTARRINGPAASSSTSSSSTPLSSSTAQARPKPIVSSIQIPSSSAQPSTPLPPSAASNLVERYIISANTDTNITASTRDAHEPTASPSILQHAKLVKELIARETLQIEQERKMEEARRIRAEQDAGFLGSELKKVRLELNALKASRAGDQGPSASSQDMLVAYQREKMEWEMRWKEAEKLAQMYYGLWTTAIKEVDALKQRLTSNDVPRYAQSFGRDGTHQSGVGVPPPGGPGQQHRTHSHRVVSEPRRIKQEPESQTLRDLVSVPSEAHHSTSVPPITILQLRPASNGPSQQTPLTPITPSYQVSGRESTDNVSAQVQSRSLDIERENRWLKHAMQEKEERHESERQALEMRVTLLERRGIGFAPSRTPTSHNEQRSIDAINPQPSNWPLLPEVHESSNVGEMLGQLILGRGAQAAPVQQQLRMGGYNQPSGHGMNGDSRSMTPFSLESMNDDQISARLAALKTSSGQQPCPGSPSSTKRRRVG